jgi:hypothetical protein
MVINMFIFYKVYNNQTFMKKKCVNNMNSKKRGGIDSIAANRTESSIRPEYRI